MNSSNFGRLFFPFNPDVHEEGEITVVNCSYPFNNSVENI